MFTVTDFFNNIFIHVLGFFMLIIIITQERMHLWLQSRKLFNNNIICFSFYQQLICFDHHNILTQQNNAKIKDFFILTEIFTKTFSLNFIHQTISFINTLLKPNMQIPTYCSLVSVNVTLLLGIAIKS